MIALQIRFPAGACHAQPWKQVRARGQLDWPPSPLRLVLSLVRVWSQIGCPSPRTFVSLLDKLADPPTYHLPRATAGNSRHVWGGHRAGCNSNENQAGVTDSFVWLRCDSPPHVCAYAVWPDAILMHAERLFLEQLCAHLNGLADDVRGWSITACEPPAADHSAVVIEPRVTEGRRQEDGPIVRRLAIAPQLRGRELLGRLLQEAFFAEELHDEPGCGGVWVGYELPPDFLMVREQYEERERESLAFGPVLFRFDACALDRRGRQPLITDALTVAETMRRAVLSRYSDLHGGTATTRLAGKSPVGVGKRTGHDHPFYLPLAAEEDPHIIALDVWLPKGCTHAEYRALASVERLTNRSWPGPLGLRFAGHVAPPAGRVWRTMTPVVLDRFPKLRGVGEAQRLVDSPVSQLHAMLDRSLASACEVDVWPPTRPVPFGGGVAIKQQGFRRRREADQPPYPVCAATLIFDRTVEGPIVIGRLAHFGMGQFRPVSTASSP